MIQQQQTFSVQQNSDTLKQTPGQSSVTNRPTREELEARMDRADRLGDFLVKLLYPDDEPEE